jgi:hypothetical protein
MTDEEFSIKCHATLNSRGETLDNAAPPPPGLIEWHEAKTQLRAPADAKDWTLAEVNLYFCSGGSIRPCATA